MGASALSTFSILQLLVYAGMQIPVGLLVDRLGTKKVLGLGVVLFTVGQLGFALSPSYGTALASRALLGCGDAMTFISVLRLGTRWFPARRGPLVAQLAGLAAWPATWSPPSSSPGCCTASAGRPRSRAARSPAWWSSCCSCCS
ncbi:hypothetical protein GCM10020295_40740 [Streptomyces cinereospinus]